MKYCSLALSLGLLTASALVPGSDSFLTGSSLSVHKKSDTSNSITNSNILIQATSSSNDSMVTAQEQEARKICPLIPPPEDVHGTFEAAMG